jgi:hypothetical protein
MSSAVATQSSAPGSSPTRTRWRRLIISTENGSFPATKTSTFSRVGT